MSEIMSELSALLGMVKDIAPEVWRIALQQVAVNANTTVFWAVLFTIGAALVYYAAIRVYSADPSNNDGVDVVLALIASILAVVVPFLATSAYRIAANPDTTFQPFMTFFYTSVPK